MRKTAPAARPGERVHPAFGDYLTKLRELASESTPSLFWERQLEPFERAYQRIEELSPEEIEALLEEGSYGFEPLPEGVEDPTEDPRYVLARAKLKEFHRNRHGLTPEALQLGKQDWEHMRALYFLYKEKLLDDYLAFLVPLGIRSSLTVSRHWYYVRQIDRLAAERHGSGPLDVLEIGAGAGNLAFFLSLIGRVASYCIVDLPEMLVHSGYTLQHRLPDAALRFDQEPAYEPSRDGRSFSFVPAQRAHELPHDSFDLCLNLNSFMEMDREVRDGYIELIYRAGRAGALFYNVNKRQPRLPLRDGTTWDSNPLLYPYRADDEVLVFEEDPFQTATRAKYRAIRSTAFTRASIIR